MSIRYLSAELAKKIDDILMGPGAFTLEQVKETLFRPR